MAYRDLRDYLGILEQQGLLQRVQKPVDHTWEPACFAKWMFQARPEAERFGLVFDNVQGSDIRIATGAIGASAETYALALGVEAADINAAWERALLAPLPPRIVDDAPCHDIVLTGKDASLDRLPIPVWTPGKDAAPYLTTPVLTRNAETGRQNIGYYRSMVRDGETIVANLNPGRGGRRDTDTWTDDGKPAPIAWVIGAEPLVQIAATSKLPFDQEELAVAGAMKGEAIELVQAKTVDLLVPANAEIVIEGEVIPGETALEGPFGEFAGYMGPVQPKPVVRITAITMRKNPIFYGVTSQMPPSESTVIQSLTNSGLLLKQLRHEFNETTVTDVHIDRTFGGALGHVVIAMTPSHASHGKKVGRLVAAATALKRVTVVDADIDIRDPAHLDWVLNSRFDPARDTVIIDDVFSPMEMDPSIRVADGTSDSGSKIVIDATQTIDSGEFSLPPKDVMMRALESWREAGLPELEIPRRATLRIDRS